MFFSPVLYTDENIFLGRTCLEMKKRIYPKHFDGQMCKGSKRISNSLLFFQLL
jgi:hypothetical protein